MITEDDRTDMATKGLLDLMDKDRAEIARLRAALETIRSEANNPFARTPTLGRIAELADAALEDKP